MQVEGPLAAAGAAAQAPSQHWGHGLDCRAERQDQISRIFLRFKSRGNLRSEGPEHLKNLQDFVRRLESALFQQSQSKAEYLDASTLEQRLRHVAQRMVQNKPRPGSASAPGGGPSQGAGQAAARGPGQGPGNGPPTVTSGFLPPGGVPGQPQSQPQGPGPGGAQQGQQGLQQGLLGAQVKREGGGLLLDPGRPGMVPSGAPGQLPPPGGAYAGMSAAPAHLQQLGGMMPVGQQGLQGRGLPGFPGGPQAGHPGGLAGPQQGMMPGQQNGPQPPYGASPNMLYPGMGALGAGGYNSPMTPQGPAYGGFGSQGMGPGGLLKTENGGLGPPAGGLQDPLGAGMGFGGGMAGFQQGSSRMMPNGRPVMLRGNNDWGQGSMVNSMGAQPAGRLGMPGMPGMGPQAAPPNALRNLGGAGNPSSFMVPGNNMMPTPGGQGLPGGPGMPGMLGGGMGGPGLGPAQMSPGGMSGGMAGLPNGMGPMGGYPTFVPTSGNGQGGPMGGPPGGMMGVGHSPGLSVPMQNGHVPGSEGMQGAPSGAAAPGPAPQGGEAPQGRQQSHAAQQKEYVAKQQRWLLFLRHCAKCQAEEGRCQYGQSCTVAKQLWKHILNCSDPGCEYPRCVSSRELLKHHQKCQNPACPVCTPVKQYVQKQRLAIQAQQERQNGKRRAEAAPQANGGLRSTLSVEEQAAKRQRIAKLQQSHHGTSLCEAMSALDISEHIAMLRNPVQTSAAAKMGGQGHHSAKNDLANWADDANACAACGQTCLTFEPPNIYCTSCAQRIKRNQVFYTPPLKNSEVKGYWCHACYSETKNERIHLEGTSVIKAELEKKKNTEEPEEGWVACDQCERWVHQICGLFNKGRNSESTSYLCPMCLLEGLKEGTRKPLPERPQSMLEAKDLPPCPLSERLEAHLGAALDQDRRRRAERDHRPLHAVPAAQRLTVRVINNVKKRLETKPRFHETFAATEEGYPECFPYTQKVIALFQQQDGVDICLYVLYMQEYGDDCPAPNRKWVYLSYLDSVKYFRPECDSAQPGIALRTLVYHEILLAYLAYIKELGFTSMFIWACPPMQGDDYILYCHPNKQKTPRSDRLREWYLTLLRTAQGRGVVTHLSNLWDTFFKGGRDHRVEHVTAAHMPYLEGDYWPGEAENVLNNISEEARVAGKKGGRGGGRAGKATKGKRFGAGLSVDERLMARLGDVLHGMREDFIVVHLQQPCSFCRRYISDDLRHFCQQPLKALKQERMFEGIALDGGAGGPRAGTALARFQLCHDCFNKEASVSNAAAAQGRSSKAGSSLPGGLLPFQLLAEKTEPIPPTRDPNPHIPCEFFDTRQAFLSLCQGNHYQFDCLRRAKHSSMMVLYHLHNPDAPSFVSTCNACNAEIEPGQGWRCTVCPEYDLCAKCKPNTKHPHPLKPNLQPVDETRVRLSIQERQDRAKQLQRTMKLLVHASACGEQNCPNANCGRLRSLFKHATLCQQKVHGGCQLCRRVWMLLQMHAKTCQALTCPVPRCRELREVRRRQITRADDQRRVAYQKLMHTQRGSKGLWQHEIKGRLRAAQRTQGGGGASQGAAVGPPEEGPPLQLAGPGPVPGYQ